MEYPDYFGVVHDPFDGALPASSSYVGHALPPEAKPGTSGHVVALIVMGVLLLGAVATAVWMYFKRDNLQPVESSTPFSAAIATIPDPHRRGEAERLNRAYADARNDADRQRITSALGSTLGNAHTRQQQPLPSSGPRGPPPPPSRPAEVRAEPPTIYRAPPGDPNFVKL